MCGAGCARPATCGELCGWHHFQRQQRKPAHRRNEVAAAALAALRRHIEALLAAGVTQSQIALEAGVNLKTIGWILSGRAEAGVPPGYRIGRVHVARIRAIAVPVVLHAGVADSGSVAAVGTVRRLRALVAAGYPVEELAARLSVTQEWVAEVIGERRQEVLAGLARTVAELFDSLQMIPGPSASAREFASARGWAPPLAWDEDSLDEESAAANTGSRKRAGFVEIYSEMRMLGFSDVRIAERLGVQPASLMRQLHRYGLTPTDELVNLVCHAKWMRRQAS